MSTNTLVQHPLAAAPLPTRKGVCDRTPQNMTSKLFVPKTADMDEGFLFFDKINGTTGMLNSYDPTATKTSITEIFLCVVLKEEPEDLTHLAPVAGDTCIPLEMPSIDFFDADEFNPALLDCLPLSGFELPIMSLSDEAIEDDDNAVDEQPELPIPSAIKEDPFIFFNMEADRMSASPIDASSPLHSDVSSPFTLDFMDS